MPFDTEQQLYYRERLNSALNSMSIELSDAQIDLLLDYLSLLEKWNKAFNLTAVRDTDEMLSRHIIDSLSILKHVKGRKILDVGTGPGLPGIPLAICYPEKQLTLVDSNIKKTRFITQSLIELGLSNVEVFHCRIEKLPKQAEYDEIVSRAFASLDKMLGLCAPYLKPDGRFLAMKGLNVDSEIDEMSERFQVIENLQLEIPSCEAERHLIIIADTSS